MSIRRLRLPTEWLSVCSSGILPRVDGGTEPNDPLYGRDYRSDACRGSGPGPDFPCSQDHLRLLSFVTAICGGSAIAALSPVLDAEDDEIAVSLATVFTLNAAGLFPLLAHYLQLGEHAFGIWAALAIHDTGSVVGAAS
jgi:hypothetical protein